MTNQICRLFCLNRRAQDKTLIICSEKGLLQCYCWSRSSNTGSSNTGILLMKTHLHRSVAVSYLQYSTMQLHTIMKLLWEQETPQDNEAAECRGTIGRTKSIRKLERTLTVSPVFFPKDFSAANDLATPKILGCFPPRSLGFLDLGVLGMALMWIMALHQLLDLLGIGSKLY